MGVLELALGPGVMLFVVGSLAGVGLGLTPRDMLAPLKHRGFVLRSLVVSWGVCPAVALVLLQVVPLERPYATGLILLALAPCAPFAPALVREARGDAAYLAAFIVLSVAATVAIMPLAVPRLVQGLSSDPLAIARPLLLLMLLPLLVGMAVRAVHADAAERARPSIATMTNVIGVVLLVLMCVIHGRGVLDAVGSHAIAVQVLFVGAITLAAHLSGSGLADDQRSVLTIGVCTRNLGAALVPLSAIDSDPRALVMIAIGVPVTVAISTFTARWLAHHQRPHISPAPHGA